MNKNLLVGLFGFSAGIVAGILGTKKYFEKKADTEIEEMRAYYEEEKKQIYADFNDALGYTAEDGEEVNPEEPSVQNQEEIELAKKKLAENNARTVNYAEMYKSKNEDPDPYEGSKSEEMNNEYDKNKNRPPRIISYEEAGNLAAHIRSDTLFYYTENDVVTDEDGNVIEDYPRLLGDCLDKYDFSTSDETLIFVMNYELGVCYEVQKIMDEYTEVYR